MADICLPRVFTFPEGFWTPDEFWVNITDDRQVWLACSGEFLPNQNIPSFRMDACAFRRVLPGNPESETLFIMALVQCLYFCARKQACHVLDTRHFRPPELR